MSAFKQNLETPHLNWEELLSIKNSEHNVVAFELAFVDMLDGDHLSALMLSQIFYWHLPDKTGHRSKLRVIKNGYEWLVKRKKDWWDEVRMTEKQAKRSLEVLRKHGFIVTEIHRFNNIPTTHIRIVKEVFQKAYIVAVAKLFSTAKDKTDISPEVPIINTDYPTKNTDLYSFGGAKCSSSETQKQSETDTTHSNPSFPFLGESLTTKAGNAESELNSQSAHASQLPIQEAAEFCTDTDHDFFKTWERHFNQPYPWPKDKQDEAVLHKLSNLNENDEAEEIIKSYFSTDWKKPTNYRVHHFISDGVFNNLYNRHL